MEWTSSKIFSRPGHTATSRHVILKNKIDLLAGRPLTAGNFHKKRPDAQQIQEDVLRKFKEVELKNQQVQEKEMEVKESFMFRAQSREQYYFSNKQKDRTPHCWNYDPNVGVVKPRIKVALLQQNSCSIRRVLKQLDKGSDFYLDSPSVWLQSKTQEFSKQLPRKPINIDLKVNEKRFETKKIPQVLQKHLKIPDFECYTARSNEQQVLPLCAKSYDTNYFSVQKPLAKGIIKFQKQLKRQGLVQEKEGVQPANGQEYYNFKLPSRVKSIPYFETQVPRKIEKENPLPSFMRSIYSRGAIQQFNQKSLDLNNFSQGQFQTVYSSFSPLKNLSTRSISTGRSNNQNLQTSRNGDFKLASSSKKQML